MFSGQGSQDVDLWLVRTSAKQIHGPFSKADLLRQIAADEWGPEDQVCAANRDWFYLRERDEVLKQLGVESPRRKKKEDDKEDTTETETARLDDARLEERARPQLRLGLRPPVTLRRRIPSLPPFTLEHPSFWKGMTWILVAVGAMVLFVVLRILRG